MGCNSKEAFADMRKTVGVPNELQMTRNLIGGLRCYTRATWQGSVHSENVQHPHMKGDKRGVLVHVGVPDCETDNGENARMHETNTYANEMHMMT